MKEIYKCFIEVLSPLHLGCDETYEPATFILDEKNSEIIIFDPFDMMNILPKEELNKFSEICAKGTIESILKLYRFINNQRIPGRRVKVCSGFVEHYNKTLSLPIHDKNKLKQEINRFSISRTAFLTMDERPFIPGSAIKGALRTGYLNYLAKGMKKSALEERISAKELEKQLLIGSFNTDPFRMVKISDFMPVGKINTKIVYAVNEKKKISKFSASGSYQILEIVEPENIFVGEIMIDTPHSKANIRNPINLKDLLDSATNFFKKEKDREDSELNVMGIPSVSLSEKIGGTLLRIGQHSGAECVTIEGYRRIYIKGKGRQSQSTTFWLASEIPRSRDKRGLQPFGWIRLIKLDEKTMKDFKNMEDKWQNALSSIRNNKIQQIKDLIKQKHDQEKKAQKLAIQKQKEKEEADRRKAELESMSPEERDIEYVKDPDAIENKVVEIYNRIDDFSAENKKKLAFVLKEYWIKLGKWDKKDCSKKQWKKVQKIKDILNE